LYRVEKDESQLVKAESLKKNHLTQWRLFFYFKKICGLNQWQVNSLFPGKQIFLHMKLHDFVTTFLVKEITHSSSKRTSPGSQRKFRSHVI